MREMSDGLYSPLTYLLYKVGLLMVDLSPWGMRLARLAEKWAFAWMHPSADMTPMPEIGRVQAQ